MPETVLHPFGPNLWIAGGDTVSVAGFTYPTRMALIRLADGSLLVWSPTTLSPDLRRETDQLGPVSFIVAPNSLHHLFIPDWRAAYPDAQLIAAPGLAKRRKDIAFDTELDDAPFAAWENQVDHVLVHGNAITTEAVFFHRESRTVLFTDLIQNFPPGWFKGWRAIIARLDRMTAPQPAVLQKFRIAFNDRKAARAAIARIQAWPADQLVMAHGPLIAANAQVQVARAFAWLIK
jgi:hypothetical protein